MPRLPASASNFAARRLAGRAALFLPALRAVGGVDGLRRAGAALTEARAEAGGSGALAREIATGTPELVRALVAIARDRTLPHRYRWAVVALVPYIASPVNLIPDILPVVGQLDDLALALLVLRWVGRGVGEERLFTYWHPSPVLRGLYERAAGTGAIDVDGGRGPAR